MINSIEVSPHDPARAYVVVSRYKFNDFTPRAFKTDDYGRSWRKIVRGIPAGHYVRVVREDPARRGLLYAGGEFGVYVSFDDGSTWQSMQLDLPITPITDLAVKRGDLVVATQGRSFWILDDLSPLRQLSGQVVEADLHQGVLVDEAGVVGRVGVGDVGEAIAHHVFETGAGVLLFITGPARHHVPALDVNQHRLEIEFMALGTAIEIIPGLLHQQALERRKKFGDAIRRE